MEDRDELERRIELEHDLRDMMKSPGWRYVKAVLTGIVEDVKEKLLRINLDDPDALRMQGRASAARDLMTDVETTIKEGVAAEERLNEIEGYGRK